MVCNGELTQYLTFKEQHSSWLSKLVLINEITLMINNSVNKESIYLIISTYHSSKFKNALQFAVYLLHALVPLHVEAGIYMEDMLIFILFSKFQVLFRLYNIFKYSFLSWPSFWVCLVSAIVFRSEGQKVSVCREPRVHAS